MAHDEKSKSFIFHPEIPYDNPKNVVGFFPPNTFLNTKKRIEPVSVPRVLKTPEINVSHDLSLTSLCLIRIVENAVFNLQICY